MCGVRMGTQTSHHRRGFRPPVRNSSQDHRPVWCYPSCGEALRRTPRWGTLREGIHPLCHITAVPQVSLSRRSPVSTANAHAQGTGLRAGHGVACVTCAHHCTAAETRSQQCTTIAGASVADGMVLLWATRLPKVCATSACDTVTQCRPHRWRKRYRYLIAAISLTP